MLLKQQFVEIFIRVCWRKERAKIIFEKFAIGGCHSNYTVCRLGGDKRLKNQERRKAVSSNVRSNQLWCADIAYMPMARVFISWWPSWIGIPVWSWPGDSPKPRIVHSV